MRRLQRAGGACIIGAIRMTLAKIFKTDDKKEVEGVRIEYPANEDGTVPYFVIRRTSRSNKEYTKALERNMRPVQVQLRTKTLANEKADQLLMQSFIEGALVTWANIPNSDVTGSETDTGYAVYSIESAKKLFTNIPDLYADLTEQANEVVLFRNNDQEETAKN